MRLAVVGHVEWVEFAVVDRVPAAGEVVHAEAAFEEPAGGGAVVAVELARLAGSATLFTALGDDALASRARRRLTELGVTVHAVTRPEPTRRALTFIDRDGERTITTLGRRLAAGGDDRLPWAELAAADGVYFTAGDDGTLRAAREAKVLVASPRARDVLAGGVQLDALVLSAHDALEMTAAEAVDPAPHLVVHTDGRRGGSYSERGRTGTWRAVAPDGPRADTYGCGDAFAAGLTHALAAGQPVAEAVAAGARSGAACLMRRGPYGAAS